MVEISVVIPVYNVEEFLVDSINSVLNQTFEDIELICVNDGSKDNSLAILQDFAKKDNRIKLINQENGGCGAARNRALDEATGKYIYFFDPDDYILPYAFEKLYNNATNNNSDIVVFKVAKFFEGRPVDYKHPGFDFEKDFEEGTDFDNISFDYHSVKRHVLNSYFAPWTKLYKKEFLDKYDDFRFPIRVAFDDVPFHVKAMLRAKRISHVPDFLYHYRLSNPNSINRTSSNGIYIMDIINFVEKFLKDEGYFEEFIKEFYYFKVFHIHLYLMSSNSEEYFQRAKMELIKVKEKFFDKGLNEDNFIPKKFVESCELIFESEVFEEYKLRLEINKLQKDNKKLKKKNKKLKKENKKMKKLADELLTSKSWKITKPLRQFKNKF